MSSKEGFCRTKVPEKVGESINEFGEIKRSGFGEDIGVILLNFSTDKIQCRIQ